MAHISIAGKVFKDPEVKFFDSGSQTCTLSVVDREYVKPKKGEEEAPGQFYDVEVWGKYAEICADRLRKGSRVGVSGKAEWQEYVAKSGEKRRVLKVTQPSVTFLDTKAEKEALMGGGSGSADFGAPSSEEIPF